MLGFVRPTGLGLFSLLVLILFYSTYSDISRNLSPQGCRMSWMSPSYVLQSQFNSTHTPLGRRYSLWLYREVGWDTNQVCSSSYMQEFPRRPTPNTQMARDSIPVLFIPGNAGSSHQIRSIASSATRQYYSSPRVVSTEFAPRSLRPLDFFAGRETFLICRFRRSRSNFQRPLSRNF